MHDSLSHLLDFTARLARSGIPCRIEQQDPESLMLTFTSGEQFVEVYFDVGRVWFSKFELQSSGEFSPAALEPMLTKHWS